MNPARAAILAGVALDEAPAFPSKRPRARTRSGNAFDELISRQVPEDRDGAALRRRKLLEDAMAAMVDSGGASVLPRLSRRHIFGAAGAVSQAHPWSGLPPESLTAIAVPRRQARVTDGRSEERLPTVAVTTLVAFRGREHEVKVLNTSRLGLMIETDLAPLIAEPLLVSLADGCSRIYFVRWLRNGRIGLGCREEDLPADGS